jgi:hypothetical protein
MENRHGLVVDTHVTQVMGTGERDAALAMAEAIPGRHHVTLGTDKHYDPHDVVRELRALRVTPHVAQHTIAAGQRHRRPDYPPSELCRASAETEMRGGDLWVAQDRGAAAEDAASWHGPGGLAVHLRRRGLQLGADAHPDGSGMSTREARDAGPPFHPVALGQMGCSKPRGVPKILRSPIQNFCWHRCSVSEWRFSAAC